MKLRLKILLIITFLALFSLGCVISRISQLFGEYPSNPGDLLFQDGFSDPSSGWDKIRTSEGVTDYEDDQYRIIVNAPNADYWANPGLDFIDVVIDVDAGKYGGPDDNDFGVLCRYQDTENFYFFIISSDGYYGLGKVQGGEQELLDPPQMYHSEAIITGTGPNHIQAICKGSQLTMKINDVLIAEAADSTFQAGDIGLIVGSFDIPGVDIWFDNLMVKVP